MCFNTPTASQVVAIWLDHNASKSRHIAVFGKSHRALHYYGPTMRWNIHGYFPMWRVSSVKELTEDPRNIVKQLVQWWNIHGYFPMWRVSSIKELTEDPRIL